MLYKIVKGRLGNQMFQYATMKAIQQKNFPDESIGFNFRYVQKKGEKSEGFTNSLVDFEAGEKIKDVKIILNLKQKIKILKLLIILYTAKKRSKSVEEFNYRRSLIEKKSQKSLNKAGIYWFTNGYCDFDFNSYHGKNRVFYGYFESLKYFDEIKDRLKEDFTPKHKELPKNKKLYSSIRNSNSICISIRRGDFVTNPVYFKKHYICNEEYFYNAIKIMKEKVERPRFIIFSDDIQWVKSKMNFPNGTLFESGDDSVWEKLRLMYNCKHFIISNSTFSWWAQYLSRNDDKIVVAPKRWFNDDQNPDIYDDNWILI